MADIPSRYVRKLTVKEKQEIDRLCRKGASGISLRAFIIRLSSQEVPIPEICRLTGLSRQTVYFWLNRFDDFGVSGLEDEPRSGRPIKFNHATCKRIVRIATSKPKDIGLHFTNWTLPKLKNYLIKSKTVSYICIESLRTCLRKGGLTLKSAQKWMISRDPQFNIKKTN
ncbi:MAG: helix-turn-helix domain-containing protein [Candidatus Edwardsbacteria bacterium]